MLFAVARPSVPSGVPTGETLLGGLGQRVPKKRQHSTLSLSQCYSSRISHSISYLFFIDSRLEGRRGVLQHGARYPVQKSVLNCLQRNSNIRFRGRSVVSLATISLFKANNARRVLSDVSWQTSAPLTSIRNGQQKPNDPFDSTESIECPISLSGS